jgi:hypothetical protein
VRRRPGRSSSGTVKVCRKPSSARGYLPPEVSSEELDGMYHSAAMTWGRHSRVLRVVCLRAYNALHISPWFQYEFQWTTDGTSDDLCHGVAIACVADGGGEDLGEGQLAKLVVQIAPAHHRARNRHRQWPRAGD